jgi:two-component system LytT family response regulator
MPLRALLVDDERLARRELRRLLQAHPEVEIVGEAEAVAPALELVERLTPDVVFLDIQMPGESGFDLLEQARTPFRVVFVTAFDRHALRAFEVNALDYLLKPVHPRRLARALERLRDSTPPKPATRALDLDDRLFVEERGHGRFVKVAAIVAVRASGDYAELQCEGGETFLLAGPLKDWDERLPERHFVRVHRSTIVNLGFIDRIDAGGNHTYRVHLRGLPEPLVMSRRYAVRVRERFG